MRPIPREIINGKIVKVEEKKHMSAVEQKRITVQRNITRAKNRYRRTTI